MAKDKDREGLSEMLGVRVSAEDLARLDAIERDPAILLGAAVKGRKAPSR